MSWDLKCTITVDENQIKELADGLGNKYAITIEELSGEINMLRGAADIAKSRLCNYESLEKLYKNRIDALLAENKQLKDENKRLRETPSCIAEYTELKKEVQELKDDNEKLIKLGIDLSGWICTLANYSGDARNRLKDNVWFEGVKRKYISEVKYGGNK